MKSALERKEFAPDRELKWVLSNARAPHVLGYLQSHLRPDPAFPGAWVMSLYFDTPDWRFLEAKLSSDYRKTKVRVRWYEDSAGSPIGGAAFLEIKRKHGAVREKVRVALEGTAQGLAGAKLSDEWVRRLPDLAASTGLRLPAPLRPAFLLSYRRERFIEPSSGLRVALDRDIHVKQVHSGQLATARRPRLTTAVLEVKGHDRPLPPVFRRLRPLGCRRETFSKYAECYAALADPLWQ